MARECVTHHYACDCREAAHAARIAELEQALAEQARLNGMGASREAALLARCEAAERSLATAVGHLRDAYGFTTFDVDLYLRIDAFLSTAINAAMAREGEK